MNGQNERRRLAQRMQPPSRAIVASMLVAVLAGCAVGPDFERPAPPGVAGYTRAPLPAHTASAATPLGQAQRFGATSEVDAQWWRGLGAARLDAWIAQAFEASPTLASVAATLRQAQAIETARTGSTRCPRVDAVAGAQRQRMNPSLQGQSGEAREFSAYQVGIGVHYRLDPAGSNRRALQALAARTDQRRHELASAGHPRRAGARGGVDARFQAGRIQPAQ